ncbi:sensor histidine kinase [Variovorax arabinosiphilus]|uniref:sensor histidine kinase n=1 Tax=Variovorax arabinosiphilus TaxID=3053498 RepID=UPI002577E3E4|nr:MULTISPECIES: ATP-binding protein [unclassified Variovorax]MDM0121167.1 ATP-binding protein [Variovorax sp. J2L1-78]MDM0130228.1 ATP-binding protein [Variovorax sp. J2L1-63]MDM0233930.1 ATP-binding protein [Variovorax sp. J2R1-6]
MRRRASAERRWRHRWKHSLRLRLITVFVLLALAMGVVFLGGMQRVFTTGWRDAAKPLLVDYTDRLVAEIGSPPDIARAQALVARLPITIRIDGPTVQWDSHPDKDRRGWWSDRHDRRATGDDGDGAPRDAWFRRSTADGHVVTFGLGASPWQDKPHGIGWLTLALLLALILAAYGYVRKLLRPLDDIRIGAERFGRGDFDQPIPLRRRDELGDLAQRINTMAHDIRGMLDAKRALLLALSHELRSPLTRARLNAELLPATDEGAVERDALLRDLNEMRDLITDLLESERLAGPHTALHREPVDLAALVRDSAGEMPGAVTVRLDLADNLPTLALDRTRMRLLVRNLLDNAQRYGAGAVQPPVLSLRPAADGGVVLEVRDFGPGVDDAQLAHLTEPFFRADSARQRTTGGVGLGMYLCRLVAEAHGGTLQVRQARPGLAVEVRLPPEGVSAGPRADHGGRDDHQSGQRDRP